MFADDLPNYDANEVPRPLRGAPPPKSTPIRVIWEGGSETTFTVAVTYTETAFDGRRPWLVCPYCHRRCRKVYASLRHRAMACRACLKLRYRSQGKTKHGPANGLALPPPAR